MIVAWCVGWVPMNSSFRSKSMKHIAWFFVIVSVVLFAVPSVALAEGPGPETGGAGLFVQHAGFEDGTDIGMGLYLVQPDGHTTHFAQFWVPTQVSGYGMAYGVTYDVIVDGLTFNFGGVLSGQKGNDGLLYGAGPMVSMKLWRARVFLKAPVGWQQDVVEKNSFGWEVQLALGAGTF